MSWTASAPSPFLRRSAALFVGVVLLAGSVSAASPQSQAATPDSATAQESPVTASRRTKAKDKKLRIGTWNLRAANPSYDAVEKAKKGDKKNLERTWNDRRAEVVRQIKAEKLDVLGVQEASAGVLRVNDLRADAPAACKAGVASVWVPGQEWEDGWYGPGVWIPVYDEFGTIIDLDYEQGEYHPAQWVDTSHWESCDNYRHSEAQFENLLRLLGPSYALTNGTRYHESDPGSAQSVRIIYNKKRVQPLRVGAKKLDGKGINDGPRFLAWAEFKDLNTGKRFFFATAHTEPGTTKKIKALRKRQARIIGNEVKKQNTAKLPVLLVGDFSSTKLTVGGNDVYKVLTAKKYGYVDPLGNSYKLRSKKNVTAKKLVNAQYDTGNNFLSEPVKRKAFKLGAHLDYTFWWTPSKKKKVVVHEWKNVMRLRKGKFAGVIPSDHNLVKATVSLP
jgi:endonuclease/exonuclease/phosphatase family metal-dependent hydrolase